MIDQPGQATVVTLRDGRRRLLRPLREADSPAFGMFLAGLDERTRRRFRPHELTVAVATDICRRLDQDPAIRLVAVTPDSPQIVAYAIANFGACAAEVVRFRHYGIDLPTSTATIAPVVAEAERGAGLGSALMRRLLSILRMRHVPTVVLLGGTHDDNLPARQLYRGLGFTTAGSFVHAGQESVDMYLDPSHLPKVVANASPAPREGRSGSA